MLRSPESRRDHTRHEAPEAGLLTIQPEDVLRAADELLAGGGRSMTDGRPECQPVRPNRTGSPAGSEWPAASACRWAFSPPLLYLFELWRRAPQPAAMAWSLALVLPGLWLRGYAAGYVKKNRELTQTGPYAYTRNPLYLGSMLIAAGFALALLSWPVALVLAVGFAGHLCSGHRLGGALSARDLSRLRGLLPARAAPDSAAAPPRAAPCARPKPGSFSFALYLRHREYNAAIGAALLYLSLLFLRPALGALVHGLR